MRWSNSPLERRHASSSGRRSGAAISMLSKRMDSTILQSSGFSRQLTAGIRPAMISSHAARNA